MKKTDFSLKSPGKVITTPRGYIAYIPDPLPPTLRWNNTILSTLSRADRELTLLAEAGRAFPVPQRIIRPFVRKEAVLSSQIEGTRTSFEGLLRFEAGKKPSESELEDAREVQNYVQALDFGLERMEALPLSNRLIREIHAKLMSGVRGEHMTPGEFRRTQNWIGRPGAMLQNARYVPPPVVEMQKALNDLERFIHQDSDLPYLIRIGLIHYQFEAIHPFLDGNGRIGRLLISLLLVAWGLLPFPLLNLSDFFEINRQDYYNLLLDVSQDGAWEAWITFFLEGIAEQSVETTYRINQLVELRTAYQQRFSGQRTRQKLADLVDYLIGTPITSIQQAQESLDLGSFTTVQRQMEILESMGIVREITGYQRNRLYQADEILRILNEVS